MERFDNTPVPYYTDSYDKIVVTNEQLSATKIFNQIFVERPKIVEYLFRFRNTLIKPLKLKPSGDFLDNIVKRNETYIQLDKTDKHLHFTTILECHYLGEKRYLIRISTYVYIENTFGKIYFILIKPFHKVLCKFALRSCKHYSLL